MIMAPIIICSNISNCIWKDDILCISDIFQFYSNEQLTHTMCSVYCRAVTVAIELTMRLRLATQYGTMKLKWSPRLFVTISFAALFLVTTYESYEKF